MARSKTRLLKELLSPYGFKQKNGKFYRIFEGESVQVIKLCRQRTLQTFCYTSVYSIYERDLPEFFELCPDLPYPYNVISFVGKSTRDIVYLTEEQVNVLKWGTGYFIKDGRPYNYYEPTMEEQLEFIQAGVLPRLSKISSQKDILDFYDELDTFEYHKPLLNNTVRICPAMACGDHEHTRKVLNTMFDMYANALESHKASSSPEEYEKYYKWVISTEQPLRELEHMLNLGDRDQITAFLQECKKTNLEFLGETLG